MNLYKKYGAFKEKNGYKFVTYAPSADFVFLNINNNTIKMNKGLDSWELYLENVEPNTEYSYIIHKQGKKTEKADPFARLSSTLKDKRLISKTSDSNYQWKTHKSFKNFNNAKIIEVYIDMLNGETYREKADELVKYLKNKNFTHVQVMPIFHNTDPITLGYLSNSYFSPHSKYGSSDDYKYFIDKLHENNYGVLMDFVLFEFGTDENGLNNYDGNYLFNKNKDERHEFFGGYLFDLNKQFVKDYLASSMNYFLEEFKIDGFRLDGLNEIIFKDSNFVDIIKSEIDNLNYIIQNLLNCILIAENITSLDYSVINLKNISFIENTNYMYQVDYLFTQEDRSRFNMSEYLYIEKHNSRFSKNTKLMASINHDLFLIGTTITKDIKKNMSAQYQVIKQKLKLSMIYAAPGIKMLFKDFDIGFEKTNLSDSLYQFINIYDKNILKDYTEFKLIKKEKTIKYEYVYTNIKISLLFNLSDQLIEMDQIKEVLYYSNGNYKNILDRYSFVMFIE